MCVAGGFLACGFDGGRVFKSPEIAQDAYDVVFLFVFDRAYLFFDHLACVLFVSMLIWCCAAFLIGLKMTCFRRRPALQ